MRFTLRSLLLAIAVIAISMSLLLEFKGRLEDVAHNGYRVQAAGDLLVDYMKERGGWPKNWDDLKSFVENHDPKLMYVQDIGDLRANVKIDFGFDHAGVDLNTEWLEDKPLFVVVSSKYGRTTGATRNPNRYIYNYLRGELKK